MPPRSWRFRSGKPPSRAATSGVRPTRSARRRSTSARRAASRSARTASARPAATTRAARSNRSAPTRRRPVYPRSGSVAVARQPRPLGPQAWTTIVSLPRRSGTIRRTSHESPLWVVLRVAREETRFSWTNVILHRPRPRACRSRKRASMRLSCAWSRRDAVAPRAQLAPTRTSSSPPPPLAVGGSAREGEEAEHEEHATSHTVSVRDLADLDNGTLVGVIPRGRRGAPVAPPRALPGRGRSRRSAGRRSSGASSRSSR